MENQLLKNVRGTIGKQLVVKQWRDKIVVTKYPDMRRVKPSELQKKRRNLFAEAVAYARAVNRNPEQKAAYLQKVKDGETVYHYAIKEYFEKNKGK